MRIHYQDKRYIIDTGAFELFLKEQGFTSQEILRLIIHVRTVHTKKLTTYGEFRRPGTIYLYTHGASRKEVNATLLHEVCHYWQEHQRNVELERRQKEHEGMRKGRKKEQFYYTYICWGDTTKREAEIAYWDRPSEIAARAFEETYAHFQFINYQQLYSLRITRTRLLEAQVDLVRTRTKRLSCCNL